MIKIIINTLIGVTLVYVWLQFVNIEEIFQTISTVNIWILILSFIFMFLSFAIRALRLKIFLKPIKNVGLKDLINLNLAALLLNFFIPIRAGEVAKSVYLSTKYDLQMGKTFIWVFLDRFIDFFTVLLVAALLLTIIPTNLPSFFILILLGGVVVFFVLTFLMVYKPVLARAFFKFVTIFLVFNKLKSLFTNLYEYFLNTFDILKRSAKDWAILLSLTLLAYSADAMIWYTIFASLGHYFSFLKMYLAQMLSALTYLVPAAPGYVGSAEASGLLILSGVLGIDSNLASSMIVLFHMATAIFVITVGLFSIYSLKLNVSEVFKRVFKKK